MGDIVADILWVVFGTMTVGLIGFVTVYSLFVREWPWQERLKMFLGGLAGTLLSFLFWFGGLDVVRAMMFYVPEPLRSWYIWLARL